MLRELDQLSLGEGNAEEMRVLAEIERHEAERLEQQLADWERKVAEMQKPAAASGAADAEERKER